jgi:general secretion pathway protein I
MKSHRGFSLIEIMIAFVIMAIALTIVIRVFSTGLTTVSKTERYSIAIQIAESLMARVGEDISLDNGQLKGDIEETYYWLVSIEPMLIDYKMLMIDESNSNMELKKVKIQVGWLDNEISSNIELDEIKQYIRL